MIKENDRNKEQMKSTFPLGSIGTISHHKGKIS